MPKLTTYGRFFQPAQPSAPASADKVNCLCYNGHMEQKQIVIVGGGFGGIKAALELANQTAFKVTLITPEPYFQYYPGLYHLATGGLSSEVRIPLDNIFARSRLQVIIGRAETVDRRARSLTLSDGQVLNYDTLILALGLVTNYFGIEGLEKFAYGTKSIEEADKLKNHLHDQLINDHAPDMNYVIVGAGPTGIELAGAMATYIRRIMKNHGLRQSSVHIDLVEAAPRLLPRSPKRVSRAVAAHLKHLGVKLYLGQAVQGETADNLTVNGRQLTSHTVVWTAGMALNPFFQANHFAIAQHGKAAVNVYLQADDDVYIIGDAANTPYSGMAQTALYDAVFVAKNLNRQLRGKKLKPYRPKPPITVIPAGDHWASVQWGPLTFSGRLGWWLREIADLRSFKDYEPWWRAAEQFLTEFKTEETCSVCQLAEHTYIAD